jgi:diaminopimelate epimerase
MTEFVRVSGGGNDFLALLEPDAVPAAATIAAWCRRGVSVGADGLFVLRREADQVRMDYWNADGQPAALCLNGTRCAARLAFDHGWLAEGGAITTGAGALPVSRRGTAEVAVTLPPPAPPSALELRVGEETYRGHFLMVGVPHFVLAWPAGLAEVPIATLGPLLRRHPTLGPQGANVHFVRWVNRHSLELRSFERGVEAETLACGTGVLAAAAVGVTLGQLELPVSALTAGGFRMGVEGESADGAVREWALVGDARVLARGHIEEEAGRLPPPATWS